MQIQPIFPQQAEALSALIHRLYPPHYTYLWEDGGAWYLAYAYSPDRLRAELEDPAVRYFWAITDGQAVGYLKINLDKSLPGGNEPAGLEVERIYFLPEAAGQGLGTSLLQHAEAMARERHKRYVWLHVMDSSPSAMAFYRKRGFICVGETWLPFERMKPEYRRMWQMQKWL